MIYYGCPKCQTPMASPDSMSGQVEICPQCGNHAVVPLSSAPASAPPPPLSAAGPHAQPAGGYDPSHAGQIVTTERTSKRLKLHSLLAGLVCIGGVVALAVGFQDPARGGPPIAIGVLALCLGLIWSVLTRLLIWWRHG